MKVSILARIVLINSLPTSSSISDMRLIENSLKPKLTFTSDEITEYGIKNEVIDSNNRLVWNSDAEPKDIEFTYDEMNLLRNRIKELDSQKLITPEILSVIDSLPDLFNNITDTDD